MSADTRPDEETTTLNVRVPVSLLEAIDRVVEERGFVSRSEFVRHQLRAGVDPAERLSEDARAALSATAEDLATGDTTSLKDLTDEYDRD